MALTLYYATIIFGGLLGIITQSLIKINAIIGDIVDISCWDGGAVILDDETYVGYKDAIGDNLVATLGEIENAILAHIAEYH